MSVYLIRRLLIGALTLLLITLLIYVLIRAMPGDPLLVQLERMGPGQEFNQEDIERMRAAYGLDKPILVAYVEWLGKLVQLDLGTSLSRHLPV